MVTSQITKDQVFTLIDQLSFNEQQEILEYLIQKKHDAMDDTPDEIVIEGIREGFREAMSGRTIPLSQMWEGIESVFEKLSETFKENLNHANIEKSLRSFR
jgi:hypothetical protein